MREQEMFASICRNQVDGFYVSLKQQVLARGVGKPGTLHLAVATIVVKICICYRQNIQSTSQ